MMLQGEQLLAMVGRCSGASRSDLVRRCGYVTRNDSGREHLHFTEFYEALLDAKGVHLSSHAGKSDRGRSALGRQLSFNTQVHFNGNLMVGRAYTEKLRLKPGDRFRIHLDQGQIRLVPMEDH